MLDDEIDNGKSIMVNTETLEDIGANRGCFNSVIKFYLGFI